MEYIRDIASDIQFDFERESNVTGGDEREETERSGNSEDSKTLLWNSDSFPKFLLLVSKDLKLVPHKEGYIRRFYTQILG